MLNSNTTVLLSLPFGGSQFNLILLCNSRIYGPKSGSLNASIPGAPPPPPGLPTFPVPLVAPLDNCPLPEPPIDGDSDGLGAYEPELVTGPPTLPDLFIPLGADVPPIGPVDNDLPTGAAFGAGTLNGVVGLVTGAGAAIGLALGLAVGGAGLAGDGFSIGCF